MRNRRNEKMMAVLLMAVMGGACGSTNVTTQPSVAGTSGGEAAHHGGAGGHHAHGLPAGPVSEMQVVLRPLAHGDVAPGREGRICAQSDTLRQRAAAIAAGPVPTEAQGHADEWRTGTARLTREADALVAECAGASHAAVVQRLEALHVAFHDLTDNI